MTEPAPARPRRRGLLAPVAAAGAAIAKYGAIIVKLKFFTLFFSMIAAVWAYALFYGFSFALGLVLLIAVHELGHVVLLRARGVAAGLPVFIPFFGAFVSMKEQPKTAYDEALSGIAGPVFGTVAAFATLGLAEAYDSQFLHVLAYVGFFINLINLLPVLPLDGGRTVAALHPALWFVGLVLLLGYELEHPTPIVPVVLVLGGFEFLRRWRGRNTEASRIYYTLTAEQRLQIGIAYVGLIAIILWAMHSYPLPPR